MRKLFAFLEGRTQVILIFHGSNKRESVFQMLFIVSFLSLTFKLNNLFKQCYYFLFVCLLTHRGNT